MVRAAVRSGLAFVLANRRPIDADGYAARLEPAVAATGVRGAGVRGGRVRLRHALNLMPPARGHQQRVARAELAE